MVNVPTYEKAVELRKKYLPKITGAERFKDAVASTVLWHKFYFGIEPTSIIGGIIYDRKLKKAVKEKIKGHKDYT